MTIVSNLVGLPEEGREKMLEWAAANFECFGPINDRTTRAFKVVEEMITYAFTQCTREKLKPDGWAKAIWDAADRGEIPIDKPPLMMNDYMGPSLDTTIFTTSSDMACTVVLECIWPRWKSPRCYGHFCSGSAGLSSARPGDS